MAEMDNSSARRRPGVWKILGGFLLVMLMLYVFSSQIEDFLYPEVGCVTWTVGDTVLYSSGSAVLSVSYEKTDKLSAPVDCMCLSGGLKKGDHFYKGDVIAYLLADHKGLSVIAPYNGTVCDVLYDENGYYDAGDPLVTISPDGSELIGRFSVDTERVNSIPGGIVKVSVYQKQFSDVLENTYFVTKTGVNAATGMTDYRIVIPKEDEVIPGIQATVIYDMVMPETYDHPVVPKDYLWNVDPDETSGVLYTLERSKTLFGESFRTVEMPVDIIDGNGAYYSVSGLESRHATFIISSSRTLRDGCLVRLREGEEVNIR